MRRKHLWTALAAGLAAVGAVVLLERFVLPRLGPGRARPSFVLITVDTLRADHLGCYGHENPTSPNVDRLAGSGVRFERAVAQAPWTLPSLASTMTGLHPSRHGAVSARHRLDDEHTTLAETLREAGYRTLAVVSHTFASSRYGFHQGFQKFDETNVVGHHRSSSRGVTETALEHLLSEPEAPFFLWVHYFDPHTAYLRHPEHRIARPPGGMPGVMDMRFLNRRDLSPLEVEYVRDVYDEEIAHTDRWIGELVDGVEEAFPETPVVYVVGSDHGEAFLDHGRFGHGRDLYRELVRVPLVISGALPAELRGTVVEEVVENTGVPRTVLGLAGLPPGAFAGEDLLGGELGDLAITEGSHAWSASERKVGAVARGWKLIRDLDGGGHELYDLETDPREQADRWESEDAEAAAARERLGDVLDAFGGAPRREGGRVDLDEEERRHLRDLGYVE